MRKTTREGTKTGESNQAEVQGLLWEEIPAEVRNGVESLRDKKVEEIRVYDLREFTPFCDFVVLGTVYSPAQARVAQNSIVRSMDEDGYRVWGIEGGEESGWLLIDFWDVVIHLFRPETRRYYNLEALWADMPWWPGERAV
jgi:ribosome-associated protein